ncbi:MAG TPA: protein kinase [Pirellulaceae bacterium]|nr:protein kinase [Pirellulaceae bacterium]
MSQRESRSSDKLPDSSETAAWKHPHASRADDSSPHASDTDRTGGDSLIGRTLSHFQIHARLGSGGMGDVYSAEDGRLARRVAVKVLSPEFTQNADRVRRFEREARAASALNHPNIVTIHDIGLSDVGRFIVMELVEGKTLRERFPELPSVEVVADIGRQIAEALDVAHSIGIVHRDIKPQNIMVRDDGYVKVLDFGLVRLVLNTQRELPPQAMDSDSNLSNRANVFVGTISYMSPEQAQCQPATAASDMFSLGIVLYELASGAHPFPSGSALGRLKAIVLDTPVPLSKINPDVPQELESLILRLLEKEPRFRPSAAETRQALTALARKEPVPRPKQGAKVVAHPELKRHTVGRERELAELQASFDRVAAGQGQIVCVSGEPGIGKTTLVEDFLFRLGAEGKAVQIGHGRCSERLASAEVYLPLLEAMEGLTQHDLEGAAIQVLKAVAPTWYVHLVPLGSSDSSAARLREDIRDASPDRLKRELAAALREISGIRPVVLVLDDLHWADVATTELLAYVATKFEGLRVLIVATFRPTELLLDKHPFLHVKQDLESRGVCLEIALQFLSRVEIERYLSLEFPQHGFSQEFIALIHGKTEGSPLFMTDLVRHLRNRQLIVVTDGRWQLARSISELEDELPQSVRSMIDRKIDQLQKADHALLTAGSVQGASFDAAVIAEAVGADPLDVEDRLQSLETVHALVSRIEEREFPDLTLTVRYRFVHALYQDAFYNSLNPGRRAALSRAVARSLERMYAARSAQIAGDLALLFREGREWDKAVDYFVQASENAAGLAAHRQAAALLTQAMEIAKHVGQYERLIELRARRGKALFGAEMWADARQDLETAASELPAGVGIRRAEVLVDLALTCWYLSDGPGIRRYGSEALTLAKEAGRNDLAAGALHALGYCQDGSSLDESVERCEQALALDPANRAPLEQLGRMLYWMGRPEEAATRSRQAVEWCLKNGRTSTGMLALGDLGMALTAAGRYREAIDVFDQAERLGREFNVGGHRARAMCMHAGLHLHLFDDTAARALAEEARELARSVNLLQPQVSAGLDLLSLHARRKEISLAENLMDEVAAGVQKGPGAHGWLWKLRFAQVQAELALARGLWEEAIRWADSTIEQSRTTHRLKYESTGHSARAAALTALGRKHEAIADHNLAVALARRVGDPMLLLRAASGLLQLDGNDDLAAEAHRAAECITAALPDERVRRSFETAEAVQVVLKATRTNHAAR